MNRYLQRCFVFSACWLLLFSCKQYEHAGTINVPDSRLTAPLNLEPGEQVVYKANLEIFGNMLSGIFVIANADSLTKVGFVSELGINYFNMAIDRDGYEVVNAIEALNRKAFMNSMARFFSLLTDDPHQYNGRFYRDNDNNLYLRVKDNDSWRRIYVFDDSKLVKRVRGRRLLLNRLSMELHHNEKKQAEKIIFLQRGISLKIEMNQL